MGFGISEDNLTPGLELTATVHPKTKSGADAQVQNPAWSIDSNAVGELIPDSGNPLSASIELNGGVGSMQVRCDMDADLGDGIENLVAIGQIDVLPGKAIVAEMTFEAKAPPA